MKKEMMYLFSAAAISAPSFQENPCLAHTTYNDIYRPNMSASTNEIIQGASSTRESIIDWYDHGKIDYLYKMGGGCLPRFVKDVQSVFASTRLNREEKIQMTNIVLSRYDVNYMNELSKVPKKQQIELSGFEKVKTSSGIVDLGFLQKVSDNLSTSDMRKVVKIYYDSSNINTLSYGLPSRVGAIYDKKGDFSITMHDPVLQSKTTFQNALIHEVLHGLDWEGFGAMSFADRINFMYDTSITVYGNSDPYIQEYFVRKPSQLSLYVYGFVRDRYKAQGDGASGVAQANYVRSLEEYWAVHGANYVLANGNMNNVNENFFFEKWLKKQLPQFDKTVFQR